uniref:PLAC8 family protein n=1 Tax=Macrostomum lignano TaxID=282301 RepID=A0A1I8F6L4_9PLAT
IGLGSGAEHCPGLGHFLSSPSVKFRTTCCHTWCWLALLTSTVLFHFHSRLNRLETLIAVWFVGLVVEEAIECRNCKSPLIYLGDMWNVMDLGEHWPVERMSCVPDFVDSRYYWIRVLYCVCLFLLYCASCSTPSSSRPRAENSHDCEMLFHRFACHSCSFLGIFMAAFGVSPCSRCCTPTAYYQRRVCARGLR